MFSPSPSLIQSGITNSNCKLEEVVNYDGDESNIESSGSSTKSSTSKRKKRSKRSETRVSSESPSSEVLKTSYTSLQSLSLFEVAPLRAHCDLGYSIGQRRGISCSSEKWDNYSLETCLFSLFYFTDAFDSWILKEEEAKGMPTERSRRIRGLLRKEVIFSLRTAYTCPEGAIKRLKELINLQPQFNENVVEGIEKLLKRLLDGILTVEETIHYSNGSSKLIHSINEETDGKNGKKLLTVQEMFEESLSDMKLLSIPNPALIISLKRGHNSFPTAIIPNLQLSLSSSLILLSSSEENDTEAELSLYRSYHRGKKSPQKFGGSVPFAESLLCKWIRKACSVIYFYMQNLVELFPPSENSWVDSSYNVTVTSATPLLSTRTGTPSFYSSISEVDEKMKTSFYKSSYPSLDLMAVICEDVEKDFRKSFCYVRCGKNPRRGFAPWAMFIPGQKPEVRKLDEMMDIPKMLKHLEKHRPNLDTFDDNNEDLRNILYKSCLLIYTPNNYENTPITLFSIENEKVV